MAALLHFKFFSSFPDYVAEEVRRGEHYDNATQYREYAQGMAEESSPDAVRPEPLHPLHRQPATGRFGDHASRGKRGRIRERGRVARPTGAPRDRQRATTDLGLSSSPSTRESSGWNRHSVACWSRHAGVDDMQIQVVQDGSDAAVTAAVRAIIDAVALGGSNSTARARSAVNPLFLTVVSNWPRPLRSSAARRRLGGGQGTILLEAGFNDGTRPAAAFCRHEYTDEEGRPFVGRGSNARPRE